MIRDLLHADRVLRLMALGLTYPQAVKVPDDDDALLIEAADIAMEGMEDDDDEGGVAIFIGMPD